MTQRCFQPGTGHKGKWASRRHSKALFSWGGGHCQPRSFCPGSLSCRWCSGTPRRQGCWKGWVSRGGARGSLITGALSVPGKALHDAVTQPGDRLTDGAVSTPRTPLNFPHGRQLKLPLYFATLQVTETQLPLPLPRFHPPEFRRRPGLSELPGLFSLLSPRGEPARASPCPCSPELTYLNVSALPGRPWCRSPRPPCWVF